MKLQGKGFFIWQIPRCEKGDPIAIADLAEEAQLTHVLVKIADTMYSYNIYNGVDLVPPLVQTLKDRKIKVLGWHYVKGDNPVGEANKAIERVRRFDLDGYVINAEAEYKQPGKAAAAANFMGRLRAALPGTMIALSSYRYPSYHPQLPWREFLEGCNFNMPQVYWIHARNAGEQLSRSAREFEAMTPSRPIIPTGAAFKEYGWLPKASEVQDFLQTSRRLNLDAVNFYSWDSARTYLPEIWQTIRDYSWSLEAPGADLTNRFIQALNQRDLDLLITFYLPNAVHITSGRTIQGQAAIRSWYQSILTQILPGAAFTLGNYTGSGNSRHFTWTATSNLGKVHNGKDTFGLIDGKITYHYSFFKVTS